MQVASYLLENNQLISSSFIFTHIKVKEIIIVRGLATANWLKAQLADSSISKAPLHTAAVGAEAERRLVQAFAYTFAASFVMASSADTYDDNLVTPTTSAPASVQIDAQRNIGASSVSQKNKSKESHRSIGRKRKKLAFSLSNLSHSRENKVRESDNTDSDENDDDDDDDDVDDDVDDDDDEEDEEADNIFESEPPASAHDQSPSTSPAKPHAPKNTESEGQLTYGTETYIAPEQALVTSVELVVPAPAPAIALPPTTPPAAAATAGGGGGAAPVQSASQYDTDVLYNASAASTLVENDKTNGCATDSSNLNVRISNNVALTTTTTATTATTTTATRTTGDILTIDRRATIWAPHGDHHATGIPSAQVTQSAGVESDGYQADLYRQQAQAQEQQQQPQPQPHPAELMVQIEKEPSVAGGFGQMLPLVQHHHNLTQPHFSQQQQQHQQPPPHLQNELQTNVYSQMMHHQQQQQQHQQLQQQQQQQHLNMHQPNIHEQSLHYANYSHRHYSHDQLFAINHTHVDQAQSQCQQHQEQQQQQQQHLQQQQQTRLQQQQHQHHLQHRAHSQHRMEEAYHDLMMDEFHEDPSSAYKLTLSPNNAKPENQDDGYETSAGDVLTPNSHSSSTQSITPQHQMQHGALGGLATQNKHEELMPAQNNLNPNQVPNQIQNQNQLAASTSSSPQVQAALPHVAITQQSVNPRNTNSVDPYSFMGEEMRILSPIGHHVADVPAASTASSYGLVSGDNEQPNDIYSMKHQQQSLAHQQQQQQHHHQHHLTHSEPFAESQDMETSRQSVDAESPNCDSNARTGPVPKRRGRKKKLIGADNMQMQHCGGNEGSGLPADMMTLKPKERKKHDRFNGMSEAEVIKRTIPDHLCDNLDIVIVGINPGLFAAYKGHHYAGPGNHFWKCLYLSGLTQEQMSADDDHTLLKQGIGFTNMVARATKGSADLTRKEIKEGSRILLEKLQRLRPKIAVFNGKLIFEVFSGKKEFHFGRQPDRVDGTDTYIWVMPSSSARCAQLPRAADKVPFYAALKKFRDFLNGQIAHMDDSECVFTEQRIRQCCEQQQQQQEPLKGLVPVGSANANGNNMEQQHAEQQSTASLMFGDNMEAGAECSNQMVDKLLPHFNATISNVVPRDGFMYGGGASNEEGMRGGASAAAGSIISEHGYLSVFGNQHQQQSQQPPPEKKKRGRPKKIKGQELMDPSTGSKITMPQHDFNNILNLSMISAPGSGTGTGAGAVPGSVACTGGETPTKKKRGRPKKVKPTLENMLGTTGTGTGTATATATTPAAGAGATPISTATATKQHTTTTSVMQHTLSMEHTASPQSSHQAPPSLYNTPPPSHILYTGSASPMASPALNCSYTHSHGTPPVPLAEQHLMVESHSSQAVAGIRDQPHLGETPPPSSPNMCPVVDFEPPNERNDGQESSHHQHQQSHGEAEHYQQWLSPSSQHQQSAQKQIQQPLQSQLSPGHYAQSQQQQPQQQSNPQAALQHYQPEQQPAEHWQRYDEHSHNRPYMLASPHQHHHHQQHQQQQHQHQHHQHINLSPQQLPQAQTQVSDVSRKSLSGLESLVDQIPSISEHESSPISSATAAAAAAAVESRLLGLQQQQQQQQQKRCHQENDEQLEASANNNNNVINNNFSVSSLAASAATASTDSSNHLGRPESTNNNNSNNNNNNSSSDYASHSPTGYPHHANHLISAALVAATAGSNTQGAAAAQHHMAAPPHPHAHPHPQMYMDHAHIASHMPHMPAVNVNSMYGSPYGPQHAATGAEYGMNHGLNYGMPQGGAPTLHVPSPNYPHYAHYGHHAPPQGNYPAFAHAAHPHHHHGHAPHHLSVFERLKPSDISGYSGF